jgi:signal recognition particle receptor subunit beta
MLTNYTGQERFKNMTRVYYKDAGAAFIVFDVTRYIYTNIFILYTY